jgi:glucosamine 6-phosphate synthetase-like amidotransferase/phosphosugar isomerase protein
MNKKDFQELITAQRFSPFVITTLDGAAFLISEAGHMLVAARMLVIMDSEGNLVHIPYRSIAHIREFLIP